MEILITFFRFYELKSQGATDFNDWFVTSVVLLFQGIVLLEVVWPILIVGIVALIRVAVPPQEHTTCELIIIFIANVRSELNRTTASVKQTNKQTKS